MTSNRENEIKPHPVLPEYFDNAGERRARVNEMFDASASHYDWITNVMSFGSGKWYRRQALLRAGLKTGMRLLDVGAGTGVVSYLGQEIVGETGEVIAVDPSSGMLEEAKKLGVKNTVQGFAEDLPFEDNRFDLLTMGYALRHVADLRVAFDEYLRVLKPGGKVLLLEVTRPKGAISTGLLKAYMKGVVPTAARVFRRSADTQKLMRYYWDTIEGCVPPETIVSTLEDAGFNNPHRHVVMKIFSEYNGTKPDGQ